MRRPARVARYLGRVATLALVVAVTLPTAARAADDGYVGVRPLPETEADAKETGLVVRIEQGSNVTRRIAVSNSTAGPLTIALSVGPAHLEHGDFVFGEPGAENDVSAWGRVQPQQLTVPAGAERVATVTFSVPNGAEGGARYGVVWAQPPAADGGGIQVVNRVGVRVALSVGSLATTGAQLTVALGAAGVVLTIGLALVVLGRGERRRARRQVERRLRPWPKKPPFGRAWA